MRARRLRIDQVHPDLGLVKEKSRLAGRKSVALQSARFGRIFLAYGQRAQWELPGQ